MKRSVFQVQLLGFAVTSLAGTLLHFLYDLTGRSLLVAPFSGVNESTWEHMKLLFWPMFVYAIVQSFFMNAGNDFWCIKLKGILLGTALIPVIFYTYNGVIGRSPDWINIAIFFFCAAVAYIYETRQFNKESTPCKSPEFAFFTFCAIAVLFGLFTFVTPEISIFKDPLTGAYGV